MLKQNSPNRVQNSPRRRIEEHILLEHLHDSVNLAGSHASGADDIEEDQEITRASDLQNKNRHESTIREEQLNYRLLQRFCPLARNQTLFAIGFCVLCTLGLAVYGVHQKYPDVLFQTPFSKVRLQRPSFKPTNTEFDNDQTQLLQDKEKERRSEEQKLESAETKP